MQRKHLLASLALVAMTTATLAALALSRAVPPSFHGTDLGPGIPAHEFTLLDTRGEHASLSDFRGRAVLMFFGYTHCPDVCPLTLGKLRLALEQVGDRARDVQVVLVTVDPEMDTPERMRQYLANFDAGFVGLTGTREQLETVTKAYGVYAGDPPPAATDHAGHGPHADTDAHAGHGEDPHAGHGAHRPPPRLIDHTSQVFGIDRRGNFRLLWGSDVTAEQVAEDVRRLLRL
jgi:protein SCO1